MKKIRSANIEDNSWMQLSIIAGYKNVSKSKMLEILIEKEYEKMLKKGKKNENIIKQR